MNKTARILSLPDQMGRLGSLSAPSSIPVQGDDGRGLLATAPVRLPVMIDGQEVLFEARAFRSVLSGEEAIALMSTLPADTWHPARYSQVDDLPNASPEWNFLFLLC